MHEDDICRTAFADAGMTRHLLRLLPSDATAELDPRRLRRLPTEHVAPGGQRRRADMAWAVGTLGRVRQDAPPAEALLALEFQSSPHRAMALRMEVYVALLRQEVAAEGALRAGGLLPRALPVVVYTGSRRWRPETLGELTAPTPAGWGGWQARFEFGCATNRRSVITRGVLMRRVGPRGRPVVERPLEPTLQLEGRARRTRPRVGSRRGDGLQARQQLVAGLALDDPVANAVQILPGR